VKTTQRIRLFLLLTAGLALVSVTSCAAFGLSNEVDPTLSSLSTAVALTATAAEKGGQSVNELATAQVKGTQKSQEIQATQTAAAVGRSETELAEATRSAPIIAELPQFNLDPSKGRTGWLQGPLVLEISGYQEIAYGNDKMEVTAADFALAADLTWDTQYGSSGCGIMFRSNGDKEEPSQYMILASRFANGHIIFTAMLDGEIANIHDFFPKTNDPSFQWQNGTTNRLAVVARGNMIEIYTNGSKIGEVDTTQPPTRLPSPPEPFPPLDQTNIPAMDAYNAQLKEYSDIVAEGERMYQSAVKNYMERQAVLNEGFLAFIAASESGRTICTFDKAWLWLIEE